MAVRRVDDQNVDPRVEQVARLGSDVAVDAGRRGDAQVSSAVDGRSVQGCAQGGGLGEDAGQAAGRVDDGRQPPMPGVEQLERLLRRDGVLQREHRGGHDPAQLGEAVRAQAVGLGDHADRTAVVDDDDRSVRAFRQQRERVTDRTLQRQGQRCVVDEVARLHPRHHVADDIGRDVLGQHGQTASPGNSLGHAAPSDGCHVEDDERAGRPAAFDR